MILIQESSYYLWSDLETNINKYQISLSSVCHSKYSSHFGKDTFTILIPVLSSAREDSKDFCRIILMCWSNFREILLQGILFVGKSVTGSTAWVWLEFDLSFDSLLAGFESCRETKFFEEEWCSFFFCTVGWIGDDVHFWFCFIFEAEKHFWGSSLKLTALAV